MRNWSYTRTSFVVLILMILAAGPLIWGTAQSLHTMFNAPLRWVPETSPALAEFNDYLDRFGVYEMVLVSWDGCTVDDPRLEKFANLLDRTQEDRVKASQPALFNQVLTGYSLVRKLMAEPSNLSRRAAITRLRGRLVGKDDKTSCAVVALTDHGASNRKEFFDTIYGAATKVTGYPRAQIRVAGPAADGYAIDQESIHSIEFYAIPSTIISFVLCVVCLRSLWLSLPIVLVASVGQGIVLAGVWLMGGNMSAILIVLPVLVFVLTISTGIHLTHYLFDELRTGVPQGAITRALKKGGGPCVLAAVTTAIGLGSLLVSDVIPVRQFGALSAIGVLSTMVLLFLLLPGAMEQWLKFRSRRSEIKNTDAKPTSNPDVWTTVAGAIYRHARLIRILGLTLVLCGGVGLTWVKTSVSITALLSRDNPAVQNHHWFEEHIGPLIPVEVLIHFDPSCKLDMLKRMVLVTEVQQAVAKLNKIDGTMSAASYFPKIPHAGGVRGTTRRVVFRRKIEDNLDDLVQARFISNQDDGQSWRISARVRSEEGTDYGKFLERLRESVQPIVQQYQESGNKGIRATFTGVTSVVHEVQRKLLSDLFLSFITALLLVSFVMMFALRGFFAGLIAMVPNIFPTATLFGAMGWLGYRVDIGAMMTASVALGIAVDGTFHFLRWFRREVEAGNSHADAVEYSFRHCGKALVQTTTICTFGLLVYVFSGFLPARNFAWMMLLLLITALIGDLVILPALLLGPWGKLFAKSSIDKVDAHQNEPVDDRSKKSSLPTENSLTAS